jgi:effector-binding domain-containing protein
MSFRLRACLVALSLVTILSAALAARQLTLAQVLSAQALAQPGAQTPAASPRATPPAVTPAAPPTPAAAPNESPPADAFGQDTSLTAKTIVYVKGSGTWDKAFQTITSAFRKIDTYLDKEGIKPAGLPMTIFTATDDTGFEYEAAVPVAEAPKNPPHGEIGVGQSPEGAALKFVHRGSYDDLDNTYEAITNYLDDKRLEAKDLFIEEYVTDPVTADANKLVVNVYVLIKQPTSPG